MNEDLMDRNVHALVLDETLDQFQKDQDPKILFDARVITAAAWAKRKARNDYSRFRQALDDCGVRFRKTDFDQTVQAEMGRQSKEARERSEDHKREQSDKPMVVLPSLANDDTVITVPDAAKAMFSTIADHRTMFWRGGRIQEIATENGNQFLRLVDVHPFIARVQYYLDLWVWRWAKDLGQVLKPAAKLGADTAKALMTSPEAESLLPPIRLVMRSPGLAEDEGRLITLEPGYNPECGGVFVTGSQAVAQVPLGEAVPMLEALLTDFDFVSPSDRSRALASFITPAMRFAGLIKGPVPIEVAEADDSQSGKTYRLAVVAAVYGERQNVVNRRNGGVGSLDESIGSRLIDGLPFVMIDNLRGRLGSQLLESLVTPHGSAFKVRVPFQGEVGVDPSAFIFSITSNQAEVNRDLVNRSSIIRIRKRPPGYAFQQWGQGRDLLAYTMAEHPRLLGAVHAVVRHWYDQGQPSTGVTEHSFREWAGKLDWVVRHVFHAAPLLQGHQQVQTRIVEPELGWLRLVAMAVMRNPSEVVWSAGQLAGLCQDEGIAVPGAKEDAEEFSLSKTVGIVMGRIFRRHGPEVETDVAVVRRIEMKDEQYRVKKGYTFTPLDGDNQGKEDSDDAEGGAGGVESGGFTPQDPPSPPRGRYIVENRTNFLPIFAPCGGCGVGSDSGPAAHSKQLPENDLQNPAIIPQVLLAPSDSSAATTPSGAQGRGDDPATGSVGAGGADGGPGDAEAGPKRADGEPAGADGAPTTPHGADDRPTAGGCPDGAGDGPTGDQEAPFANADTPTIPALPTAPHGKHLWVYDLEVFPDYFLAVLTDGKRWVEFGEHDLADLARFVDDPDIALAGFNNHAYDDLLLRLIVAHPDATCADLYRWSCQIINPNGEEEGDENFRLQYSDAPWGYSIDVFQLLNGRGSLKEWACCMGHPLVAECPASFTKPLPDEMVEPVRRYCHNDVMVTARLLADHWHLVELRTTLAERYRLGWRAYHLSEPQLGQHTFLTLHRERTGERAQQVREAAQANPDNLRREIPLTEIVSPRIAFETEPFRDLLRRIRGGVVIGDEPGQSWSLHADGVDLSQPVTLAGREYSLGVGGLHSVDGPGVIVADDDHALIDLDVTSYYPSILITEGLYPAHIGPAFVEDLRRVRDDRVAAKRSGDKATADALKIVINATFGKLNDSWSPLRSIPDAHRVTINGQLFLLMLVEMLSGIGAEIVSANTDGVTVRLRRDVAATAIPQVIERWQAMTGMELEPAEYQRLCRRDVNSYLAITTDGKVKSKGTYNPESGKRDGKIIKRAVNDYLLHGIDPTETIAKEQNPAMFLFYQRVKNGGALYHGEDCIGQSARWYASLDAMPVRRQNPNGTMATVPHGGSARMALDITGWTRADLVKLDVQYYLDEAWKHIKEVVS
jgi:hypothetical protein